MLDDFITWLGEEHVEAMIRFGRPFVMLAMIAHTPCFHALLSPLAYVFQCVSLTAGPLGSPSRIGCDLFPGIMHRQSPVGRQQW